MSLEKLIETFNFEHISTTGQIRYDLEKLRWMNHQWIRRYDIVTLTQLCQPYLAASHVLFKEMNNEELQNLVSYIQPELVTLEESPQALEFVVTRPSLDTSLLESHNLSQHQPFLRKLFKEVFESIDSKTDILPVIQRWCKNESVPSKDIFTLLRFALTGKTKGLSIKDLQSILDPAEMKARLERLIA